MKLRSGKVLRRARTSPKITPGENVVVQETCIRVTSTTSPLQGRRRSPRNLTNSAQPVNDVVPSYSTHSMTLRSRKN
jgi:hypothetical protein